MAMAKAMGTPKLGSSKVATKVARPSGNRCPREGRHLQHIHSFHATQGLLLARLGHLHFHVGCLHLLLLVVWRNGTGQLIWILMRLGHFLRAAVMKGFILHGMSLEATHGDHLNEDGHHQAAKEHQGSEREGIVFAIASLLKFFGCFEEDFNEGNIGHDSS